MDDFKACAKSAVMQRGRAETIVAEVSRTVRQWPDYADQVGVSTEWRDQIWRRLWLDMLT